MIWFDSCFWKIALDGAWPGREQSGSQETPKVVGMVYIIRYLDSVTARTGGLGADGCKVHFEGRIDRD